MEIITIHKQDLKEIVQSIKITFVISTLIATFISIIIPRSTFLNQFLASQSIGLTMVTLFMLANILCPALSKNFKYQYYFLPFPVLIATLIGLNFLKHLTFLQLYGVILIIGLPALLVFHYRNTKKVTSISFEEEKQKRNLSEKQLLESKLLLLQAQINPHFLFNTLANIDAYIDDFPEKAKKLLSDYTQFLRHSLKTTQQKSGSLADEVALIDAYMAIQQTRFPQVEYKKIVDEALLNKPLPPLIIQPLIENALLHGLAPQGNQGCIRLIIKQQENCLSIEVKDDGVGLNHAPQKNRKSNGIALKNIQSRLALANHKATLLIQENPAGGTDAIIQLPQ